MTMGVQSLFLSQLFHTDLTTPSHCVSRLTRQLQINYCCIYSIRQGTKCPHYFHHTSFTEKLCMFCKMQFKKPSKFFTEIPDSDCIGSLSFVCMNICFMFAIQKKQFRFDYINGTWLIVTFVDTFFFQFHYTMTIFVHFWTQVPRFFHYIMF